MDLMLGRLADDSHLSNFQLVNERYAAMPIYLASYVCGVTSLSRLDNLQEHCLVASPAGLYDGRINSSTYAKSFKSPNSIQEKEMMFQICPSQSLCDLNPVEE